MVDNGCDLYMDDKSMGNENNFCPKAKTTLVQPKSKYILFGGPTITLINFFGP
jgi:hypothetical protein